MALLDVYALALDGLTDQQISDALGLSPNLFSYWKKNKPEVAYALQKARGSKSTQKVTFTEYVYRRLSPELQTLWDQIELWKDHPSGNDRVAELLDTQPDRIKQSLFLHALLTSNFNSSAALKTVNVSYSTLRRWQDEDPNFVRICDEIAYHKKNFFESKLVQLVRQGSEAATIFANKTLNKDRGYSEKVQIDHTGNVNVNVGVTISVDQLKLPLEVRKTILSALREAKQAIPTESPKTINSPAFQLLSENDPAA